MPELPDITVYIEALEARLKNQRINEIRRASPFFVRSVEPPLVATHDKKIVDFKRIGKRIALGLEQDLWLVIHLMIAGRFQWKAPRAAIPNRLGLAAIDTDAGTLIITEAGSKKRASLHLVQGPTALKEHDPGGIEPLSCSKAAFSKQLTRANHTLKRALTDPRLFSGIGNAYSDEILHAAKLSPIAMTQKLTDDEQARLFAATRKTLKSWTKLLRQKAGNDFPKKVPAFHPEMATHGKFGKPCPVCETPIQRIRYASNETNYCPTCQTGGQILADRSLSRLLKKDWPRSVEEWERRSNQVS